MSELIERYVYDVVRRIPEKEREEVGRELTANILDMLSNPGDENEVRAVLGGLGPPSKLAGQYRQSPNHLISPAIYDDYVRTLKWVAPLVGCVMLVIGAVLGAIEAIGDGSGDIAGLLTGIISSAISTGVSGVFHAIFWTTVGFAIADRTGAKSGSRDPEWTVDQLPIPAPDDKSRIPLSDCVADIVVTLVFAIVALFICVGAIPNDYIILKVGDAVVYHLFTDSFLAACVPAIVVCSLLGVFENVIKIYFRRWTPAVCASVILSNVASIGYLMYLVTHHEIFSFEFIAFVEAQEWGQFDIMRSMGNSADNPIVLVIVAIAAICALIDCGVTIYRTIKATSK